jgi:uncharacterized protein YPO0396
MSVDAPEHPSEREREAGVPAVEVPDDAVTVRRQRRHILELQAEIEFLRSELEREREARNRIIDRYEALLAERQPPTRRHDVPGDSLALRVKRALGLR